MYKAVLYLVRKALYDSLAPQEVHCRNTCLTVEGALWRARLLLASPSLLVRPHRF